MEDREVVVGAGLVAAAALRGWPSSVPAVWTTLGLMVLAALLRRPVLLLGAVAVLAGSRSAATVEALDRTPVGVVHGVAELVTDPEPGRFGTRVQVRLGANRYAAEVPRSSESLVAPLLTGERLVVRGRVGPLRGVSSDWRLSRHLAGTLRLTHVERGPPADPWYRLANGVHRLLARGAGSLGEERRALFLGLVLGDDRAQTDVDRFRFRSTGLGHLLAVSGQNVAFVLVLARPILSRCGLRARVLVGLAVLVLFVLVTRAEPSVLRATAMAAVALVAAGTGRVASGRRILALAVAGLLVADPVLVRSVGFRLSVAASIGLLLFAGPLERRLPGPSWLREPLSATLSAQAGTLPVTLGLSGGVPVVSVAANLLAVPAAGMVMVVGLGAGLVAGTVQDGVAAVLHLPTRVLLAWIDGVARVGARVPAGQLGPARLAWPALVLGLVLVWSWWRGERVPAGGAGRSGPPTVGLSAVRSRWRLVAVAVLCSPVLLPPPLGPHPRVAAPGAEVRATACGFVVAVGPAARTGPVLEGLWRLGVTTAVEVRSSGADREVVAEVGGQLLAAQDRPGPACSVRGRAPPPRRP